LYNSLYPININYRKPQQQYQTNTPNYNAQKEKDEFVKENKQQDTFPNGTKVAIDYSRGQINISQVLTDFRSTILAINAPDDVRDEVYLYLNLVEKESKKESPSKDIILSNLKNASRISDSFIAKTLNKPSNVVEGWIDALFLQKINLKSDPGSINPDFKLDFPQKAQERIDKANQETQAQQTTSEFTFENMDAATQEVVFEQPIPNIATPEKTEPSQEETTVKQESETISVESVIDEDDTYIDEVNHEITQSQQTSDELSLKEISEIAFKERFQSKKPSAFSPYGETDLIAKELFTQSKQQPKDNVGAANALNLLNEALGYLDNEGVNENLKAAVHFERAKIFDGYDYVDYALRDYWEATKAQDYNLKANAFYKSAKIYDEFNEFSPALSNYLSSVAYSGEADNINAQTKTLSKIASLYAKQYDIEKTLSYTDLAIDTAYSANDEKLIANTYSEGAQNYQYIGEDDLALDGYKNALSYFSHNNESYEQMAYNYEQASIVMAKLGNQAKAETLLSKANLYYQKAQLQNN